MLTTRLHFLRPGGRLVTLMGMGLVACSTPEPPLVATTAARTLPDALTHLVPYFDAQWAMQPLWDDGLAEVAVYEAQRTVYDKVRRFELVQLTVKEDFNQQYQVKTDNYQRPDLFPVIKVNQFCRIETDQYPYHYLTSLFFRRQNPVGLYKLTSSSQEWCGNTFKAFLDNGRQYTETFNSYWDGQGAGERHLRRNLLFEDALPYTLRSLRFEKLPAFPVDICETQQTSKATPPTLYAARLSVAPAAPADAPEPAWQVRVQLTPDRANTYWFTRRYPHVLLRQTTWDGRTLRLRKVSRYAYWTHPAPAPADSGRVGR
jgi:hypothetical protein